ncbi:hypothetical protein EZS27_032733, partial [termite gut metagenome]
EYLALAADRYETLEKLKEKDNFGIVKLILKYYLCLKKIMDCPRCGSLNYRKDGFVQGRQRYECKECRYHYR